MSDKRYTIAAAVVGLVALAPGTALAYVGPGAGLSAIGTFLALVAACLLAIVGFVWYPVKRLLRRPRSGQAPADTAAAAREPGQTTPRQ